MKTGETYRCPDEKCGCEIEVLRGTDQKNARLAPRCCCGKDMRVYEPKHGSSLSGEMRAT